MKILLDMNISPDWVPVFQKNGWECLHWMTVGDQKAADEVIFNWARDNGFVVFTHDLDFGTILAATNALAPSVIQIRIHHLLPGDVNSMKIIQYIARFTKELESGALITIDEIRMRVRILPLH
jgi:predicted nuclease of predicted toxin-antitoxin system